MIEWLYLYLVFHLTFSGLYGVAWIVGDDEAAWIRVR